MKRWSFNALLTVVSAGSLTLALAQQPPKPAKAPPIPVVAVEVQNAYHKAREQYLDAVLTANAANAAVNSRKQELDAAMSAVSKVCGDKFDVHLNNDGDPVCLIKPALATPTK